MNQMNRAMFCCARHFGYIEFHMNGNSSEPYYQYGHVVGFGPKKCERKNNNSET